MKNKTWRKILQPFFRDPQSGMSLMSVVMYGAIGLVATTGTLRVLDDKVAQLRILRMQSQLDSFQDQVAAAAASRTAMTETAKKLSGHPLQDCMVNSNCVAGTTNFQLYNTVGSPLSGYFDINGKYCDTTVSGTQAKVCPILITTQLTITCSGGSPCYLPNKLTTTYTVAQASTPEARAIFGGRTQFKSFSGTVDLGLFSCPPGEYVKSVGKDGSMTCHAPQASGFAAKCDVVGTAGYGLTDKGTLKCAAVANFCMKPLAVALIFDMSGSMDDDNKVDDAKAAGKAFVDLLQPGDTVATISFSRDKRLELPWSTNFTAVKGAIDDMRTRSGTLPHLGFEIAWEEFPKITDPNQAKVVLLLGDGMSDKDDWEDIVPDFRAAGIPIWTIGLGKDADETELRAMASTPAQYYFASNGGELKAVYDQIGSELCRVGP
jgi:hypothetical protein